MNLQPKTTSLLRIISVAGILLLLVLQYLWLKNAYKTIEQNLINQSAEIIKKAVDEEINYREASGRSARMKDRTENKEKDEKVVEEFQLDKMIQIRYLINDVLTASGTKIDINYIDSVYSIKINEAFGYEPAHRLKLIKGDKLDIKSVKIADELLVSNLNGEIKITYRVGLEHLICLELPSPQLAYIHIAKYILLVSLIIVLLVGTILIMQFYNLKREEKFSDFIVDYTKMIAHDLQSPIASIRMMLHKLSITKRMEASQLASYYKLSMDQSDKLLYSLNTLLYLALAERNKLQVNCSNVDVEMFVEKVCDRMRQFEMDYKRVNIQVQMRPERFAFVLDFNLMENIIYNLLDNAVKYSNEIVNITITCEQTQKGMCLTVQDDGIGMTEVVLKRIKKLFKCGSKYDGTLFGGFGIGLTFVYEAVKAIGGKITVESKEKIGTLFTINLPSMD